MSERARARARSGTSAPGPSRRSRASKPRAEVPGRLGQQGRRERVAATDAGRAELPDRLGERARLAVDLGAPLAVRLVHRAQHVAEAGIPWRGSGGKYVPPQNGSPSGVRNTVIGQPPWPVSATTASM